MLLTKTVDRAKHGDREAWGELYTSTCKEAYFVAVKVCGKEQDAVDLVQDAYITAFERLHQLQDPERFQSWLNMIVANHCRDYLKKKHPALFSELEADDGSYLDWADEREYAQPDAQIDHEETVRLVAEIISALPEDQRLCVMLYYREEMSISEISQALEVSEGTVKSRLNYARQKVAKKVKELEKQGTKLYGLAPVPFLLFLLRSEADASVLPTALASSASIAAGSTAAAVGAKGILAAGVKSVFAGIGVKIAAGALAAAVAVGGTVFYLNDRNDPPVSSPPAESVMPSVPTPSAETGTVSLVDEAYRVYEELLALGVTETGMEINYYTYLDLNSDGVPELLVCDYDRTPNSWCTGVLYTYKNSTLQILGETSTRDEPFYLVNGKYLLGRARMGNEFFACDESMLFDGENSNPTVRQYGGEISSITEDEFNYYYYLPAEAAELGIDCFIKTANPIRLQRNAPMGWVEITTTVPDDFSHDYLVLQVIELSTGYERAFQILRENNYTLRDEIPVGTYLIDLVFVYQDYRYQVTAETDEFTVTAEGLATPIRLTVEMMDKYKEKDRGDKYE